MFLQRVGLVGDVHSQFENLSLALQFLSEAGVELVLCTGDIPDGPHPLPAATEDCAKLLREHKVLTVRGNHDRWLLAGQTGGLTNATPIETLSTASLDFIRSLQSTLSFDSSAGQLLLCHGMGENDMQGVKPDDDDHALQWKPELHELIGNQDFSFVVAGHTHQRMVRRFERTKGALVVINAGTLHPDFSPCFAIADFSKQQIQFFDLKGKAIFKNEELSLS